MDLADHDQVGSLVDSLGERLVERLLVDSLARQPEADSWGWGPLRCPQLLYCQGETIAAMLHDFLDPVWVWENFEHAVRRSYPAEEGLVLSAG